MRVLMLTDNFPPEQNAPATRTIEHAKRWAARGASVTVVTGVPNFPAGRVYPGYRNLPLSVEYVEGIRVVRVWSYVAPNAGFLRRIIDYVSYAATSSLVATFLPFDIIVATSPQFFTAVAGWYLATLRGKPWIFEVRDLWPESIKSVGAMRDGLAIRLLERLELLLYRQATRIVTVTRAFRENLISRGIRPGKIRVVPNGVSPDFAANKGNPPVEAFYPGERPLRLAYVGTHGMAHGLEFVIRAIAGDPSIHLDLVGDGAEKPRLRRLLRRLTAENVSLYDPIPRSMVPTLLSQYDFALVPLKNNPTFRTVIPSKIFEAAASRTPVLLGVEGEAKEVIEHYGAGITFHPEDADSFRAALREAASVRRNGGYQQMRDSCGRLARDYARPRLANRMLNVMEEIYDDNRRERAGLRGWSRLRWVTHRGTAG